MNIHNTREMKQFVFVLNFLECFYPKMMKEYRDWKRTSLKDNHRIWYE